MRFVYSAEDKHCTVHPELVEGCTTLSRSCFDSLGRTQHERLSSYPYFVVPMKLGVKNSIENRYFNHLTIDFPRPVWERIKVRGKRYFCSSWILLTWATTGGRPDGLNTILLLHSTNGYPGTEDSVKNVILNPLQRMKNLSLREYDNLSTKTVLSAPPAPHSWGNIGVNWGTPPNPCQRGKATCGISLFMFYGAVGSHTTANSVENVILSVAKNLSLREKESLCILWNPPSLWRQQ